MIPMVPGTKVYLACHPVSMRLGFDGLAARVAQVLDDDPFICVGRDYVAASPSGP
jgi:transposase